MKKIANRTAGCITMWMLGGMVWAQPKTEPVAPPEPPMLGIHWARGAAAAGGRAGTAPLMTYHDGTVMHTSVTLPIFWGTSWKDSTFVQDKMTGLASFYSGEGSSTYAATSDEYTDTTGSVTSTSTYLGSLTDLSTAVKNGNRTAPILQEVCNALAAAGVTPVSNGYYPVYVDTPRGHSGFCAWHSWGSCNNVPIQFAFFFSLDGDAGCDPEDTSGLHSQGLAALANVSGHELSEARTDPRGAGWFDAHGAENADKCSFTFGTPLLKFSNKSEWKIQGNWSNAAYSSGRGYPNSSGQNGCIDGGNFK
jgi:hypothetical protein